MCLIITNKEAQLFCTIELICKLRIFMKFRILMNLILKSAI